MLKLIPIILLVMGWYCLIADLIRDNRGIKQHGFMEYMEAKGPKESRLTKAFAVFMVLAVVSCWIIRLGYA